MGNSFVQTAEGWQDGVFGSSLLIYRQQHFWRERGEAVKAAECSDVELDLIIPKYMTRRRTKAIIGCKVFAGGYGVRLVNRKMTHLL